MLLVPALAYMQYQWLGQLSLAERERMQRTLRTAAYGFLKKAIAAYKAILKRDPHATPVNDVLTYYVDLMCWFLEGNRPVEVVARGQRGIFRDAGYSADDVTWAILTMADGAVINLGISYALPAQFPTQGQSDRVELLGTEGTMLIDDDHKDHLMFSEKGVPHPYVPGHNLQMAFLGSNSAGDWALGDFWGSLGNETRAWLDHLDGDTLWCGLALHVSMNLAWNVFSLDDAVAVGWQATGLRIGTALLAVAGFAVSILAASAWAQSGYPERPINIVIPFATGG